MAGQHRVTWAIRAIGMTQKEFAEQKLGLKYTTFKYRLREGLMDIDHIHTICFVTGRSFDDLWPNPNIPRIAESQTIRRQAYQAPAAMAEPDIKPPVRPQAATQPRKDKGEEPKRPSPPSEFVAFNVFEGGLPPIDAPEI